MTNPKTDHFPVIRELVSTAAPRKVPQPIELHSRLRADLGFDSIGLMTLAFKLETTFDVDLSGYADHYRHIETVADVARFIDVVLAANQP